MSNQRSRKDVTIADVAEAAGTSSAVVSYVINDGPRNVSPATRDRVLKQIERLGYRPNRIAKALRSNRTRTLGLLVPSTINAFFSDLIFALETAAFERGYVTFVGNASFDRGREINYLEAFDDLQVDGVFVVDLDACADGAKLFSSLRVARVFLHYKPNDVRADFVHFDEIGAGQLSAEALAEQKPTSIVVVAGADGPGPVGVRSAAFTKHFAQLAPHVPVWPTIETSFNRAAASAAFSRFLDATKPGKGLGVLAATDEQAIGVLHAASTRGLQVPGDMSVIAAEGTTAARCSSPPLSSIDLPISAMARHALDLLERRLAQPDVEPVTIGLPSSYSARASTE